MQIISQPRFDNVHIIKEEIVYGYCRVSEHGDLRKLINMYISRNGLFARQLAWFLPCIGKGNLHDEKKFITLLEDAGRSDPIMGEVQLTYIRNMIN